MSKTCAQILLPTKLVLYILFQKMTGKYNYIEAFIAIVVIFSIAYSMQYYYNRMINRINL